MNCKVGKTELILFKNPIRLIPFYPFCISCSIKHREPEIGCANNFV